MGIVYSPGFAYRLAVCDLNASVRQGRTLKRETMLQKP
jgi:hypothetical protein